MDFLKADIFLKHLSWKHHFKQGVVRVETFEIHLNLIIVNRHVFDALFDHFLLVHVDSAFLFTLALLFWVFFVCLSCLFFNELFDKVGVFEHRTDALKACLTRIKSKSHRQLVVQCLQEDSKFFLRWDHRCKDFLQTKNILS